MPVLVVRREFLARLGAVVAATASSPPLCHALLSTDPRYVAKDLSASQPDLPGSDVKAHVLKSPFRVSIINDEISQDFGRACEVASREFGMEWIKGIVQAHYTYPGKGRCFLLRTTD